MKLSQYPLCLWHLPLVALSESSSRPPLPAYDLAVVAEKLTSAQVVAIQQTRAVSSTSVRLTWEVRRHSRYIEGFIIKYRPVTIKTTTTAAAAAPGAAPGGDPAVTPTEGGIGSAGHQQQVGAGGVSYSEERVADGLSTSIVIQSLKKYTTYEMVIQPYYRSIIGLESVPARVRTLEDGLYTSPRTCLHWDVRVVFAIWAHSMRHWPIQDINTPHHATPLRLIVWH